MNDFLRDLVRETLQSPRTAARRLIDLRLPPEIVWSAFGAVVAASAVLGWLSIVAIPVGIRGVVDGPQITPLTIAMAQAGSLLLLAGLSTAGGRVFGGRGRFLEAVTLAAWLEFMLVLLQLLQLLAMVLFPFFSMLIGFLGMALFLWLLTNFVAELHGFSSLPMVFFGIIGGFLIVGIVAVMLFGTQLAKQGF